MTKNCHLCSISQESFIIWSWLVVHKLNMMISLGVFLIFSKPWFFSLLGGSKGKKWLKTTKNSFRRALHLRNHTSYDRYFWCACVKWWHLQMLFSFFQNFGFSCCYGGKREKNGTKWQSILSALLPISETIPNMIVVFGTHM